MECLRSLSVFAIAEEGTSVYLTFYPKTGCESVHVVGGLVLCIKTLSSWFYFLTTSFSFLSKRLDQSDMD
jgi:hypothetical protein